MLYPSRNYTSIGARVASWRTQSRLRRADEVTTIVFYQEDESAEDVVAEIDEPYVLVVIDPLVIVERDIAAKLRSAFEASAGAVVIAPARSEGVPLLYFCTVETLRDEPRSLRRAIDGRMFSTATTIGLSAWEPETSPNLLPFVPDTARTLLHVGCGDGALGEQIKGRQRCRVLGVEADRDLAANAKRRIDDIYIGDFEEVISILQEQFDCVVTTSVLEQVTDPWSLLADLRKNALPGGVLIAALPNLAAAPVIADLLKGHFDLAKQMRFFTRDAVEELMEIAGWTVDKVEPLAGSSDEDERLALALRTPGSDIRDDLLVRWFIVVARTRG